MSAEETLRIQGELIATLQSELEKVRQQNNYLNDVTQDLKDKQAEQALPSSLPVIDSKLVGKPDFFHGDKEKWKEWAFVTRMWLCANRPEYQSLFKAMRPWPDRKIDRWPTKT